MGEKIKDIQSINLIGNELMIELNEGYTKKQGRVIHIQNDKFRYLLTESDFCLVSALIMRAAVELHYIKTHLKEPPQKRNIPDSFSSIGEFDIVSKLSAADICYRVLHLKKHLITIIIHPEDFKKFHKLASSTHMKKIPHPYGEKRGYTFLYQMQEFEMYEYQGYYYEIMAQLPCMSLTPKTWIPLDRIVQKSIWENEKLEGGISYISDEDYWIYIVTSCLFQKKTFSETDRKYLQSSKNILDSETLMKKLQLIVFQATDMLIDDIKKENYDDIISHYYGYLEY